MIAKLMRTLQSLKESESGVTAIEYSIIAGGISIVIIVAVGLVGGSLEDIFTSLAKALGADLG